MPLLHPGLDGPWGSDGRKAAERFLERYNRIGSHRPADYADLRRNASYFVALLEHR